MFDQYAQIINEKYPYILVNGDNFQPPGFYMLIVRIIVSNCDKHSDDKF